MTYSSLRKLAVRLLTPLSWRASDQRMAKSLYRFSQVEADSAWQMLQALNATTDRDFKAALFNNALEEVHHAALFSGLAREFSSIPPSFEAPRRHQIYNPEAGLPEFEAFHFVGEAEVYDQFYAYASAAHRPIVREMFMRIRGDEEEHQKLAYRELTRLCGSEGGARRMIRRVRRQRLYEAWVRLSKAMGDVTSSVLLNVLFFLTAPFFAPACRRRLSDTGWKAALKTTLQPADPVRVGQEDGIRTAS
jgi:hypothetical protein